MNTPKGTYVVDGVLQLVHIGFTEICSELMCICSEVASGSGHGLATDIFSLGSVLYTMLVGGPPFESSDLLETINRIKAVLYKMPNLLSAKAQHLIMSVMRLSPDDRLTLNGLYWFPLFSSYCELSFILIIILCSNLYRHTL